MYKDPTEALEANIKVAFFLIGLVLFLWGIYLSLGVVGVLILSGLMLMSPALGRKWRW